MKLVINEDTTFLIGDERGDIPPGADFGLYHEDTRFLSAYTFRLDGKAPVYLAARTTESYAAAHFLTNPALSSVRAGQLGIVRRRQVGRGLHEDIDITNYGDGEAAFDLELQFGADFAHIFDVKGRVEGRTRTPPGRPGPGWALGEGGRSLRFEAQRSGFARRLVVNLSAAPDWRGTRARFGLRLRPHQGWHLCVDFLTLGEHDGPAGPTYTCRAGPAGRSGGQAPPPPGAGGAGPQPRDRQLSSQARLRAGRPRLCRPVRPGGGGGRGRNLGRGGHPLVRGPLRPGLPYNGLPDR